jgi:uncharacterized protein
MLESTLTIQNPYGISVFGSARLRISPDSALINAILTRVEEKPAAAFSKTKEGARNVTEFLRESGIQEFGTSIISLAQENRIMNGEIRYLGYKATVGFTIVINSLAQLEEVVSGIIEAGANQIAPIEFQTSELKNLRERARQLAIEAAKEKALTYSQAAGASLGRVIHIQDVNPRFAQGPRRTHFTSAVQIQSPPELFDGEQAEQTLDPGAIEVAAAVLVAYSLGSSIS